MLKTYTLATFPFNGVDMWHGKFIIQLHPHHTSNHFLDAGVYVAQLKHEVHAIGAPAYWEVEAGDYVCEFDDATIQGIMLRDIFPEGDL